MNDNRVPDTFHKIPNTNTWLSKTELDCTRTFYANQHVRIGKVIYRIPDNIVRKLPDDIYEKIQFIAMVHDVPIGELKVNYAREKLDVSEQATIKKLLNLMTKAYYSYAEKQATLMNASETQEIIDHISKTCAQEIDELNKMIDELDTFIK